MRLLFIAPDLPYPLHGGGKIRIYSLMKNLAKRHEVCLIAFDRQPDDPSRRAALEAIGADVLTVPLLPRQMQRNKRKYQLLSLFSRAPYQYFLHYSPQMQRTIDAYLSRHHVDVVDVEFAQMGYYTLPREVPSVITQHNIEHDILYRTYQNDRPSLRKLYAFAEWQKFKRDEIAICRRFPLCLTTSDRDRQLLARYLPSTMFSVVPNGVDTDFFQREVEAPAEDNTILFTGTIDYHPNVDGLKHFVQEVLPLIRQEVAQPRFYVVGKNPPPEIQRYAADPRIVVTGSVEDVRDYYRQAAVVVVPLRVGGGTRLKILEAMAMGRPVVSTSLGAEGLEVVDGKNIIIADQPAAMAQAVVTLLQDGALRARLAAAGRRLVEERYDWKLITQQLEGCYQVVKGGNR